MIMMMPDQTDEYNKQEPEKHNIQWREFVTFISNALSVVVVVVAVIVVDHETEGDLTIVQHIKWYNILSAQNTLAGMDTYNFSGCGLFLATLREGRGGRNRHHCHMGGESDLAGGEN